MFESPPPVDVTDAEALTLPLAEVVRAVDEAFRALGTGEIVNPPRRETVGRPGDPDYFRLELTAERLDPSGKVQWRCRKIVEEAGARDEYDARSLGTRRAWIELDNLTAGRRTVLDADAITNLRTGAAAVLSARYLAPNRPLTIALVGTGRIASAVVSMAPYALDVAELRATSRHASNRERFFATHGRTAPFPVSVVENVGECVAGADVVVAAVPSSEPVVLGEDVHGAAHVTLVGGDPRVVLGDHTLWTSRAAVPDDPSQAENTGDCIRARAEGWDREIDWVEIRGRLATLADAARGHLDALGVRPTLALLTGMGALDLALAQLACERHA